MHIRLLEEKELLSEAFFRLIRQLNPGMDRTMFERKLAAILKWEPHYRAVGAFDDNGKMLAASGYWIGARFYSGVFMQMDNFVVDESLRNSGIGVKMLAWLEAEAKRHGCERIILDSYVENSISHKFYFKHGFTIAGFHFNKRLITPLDSASSAPPQGGG